MFKNRERDQKIRDLEIKVATCQESYINSYLRRIKILEEEVGAIKNPPLFKTGDKVKGLTIISSERKNNYVDYTASTVRLFYGSHWEYKALDHKTKNVIDIKEVDLARMRGKKRGN